MFENLSLILFYLSLISLVLLPALLWFLPVLMTLGEQKPNHWGIISTLVFVFTLQNQFKNLSLIPLLLLSALSWFLPVLMSTLGQKPNLWDIICTLAFIFTLQKPLAVQLENINLSTTKPAWMIAILNFLQSNPIVPVMLLLLLFGSVLFYHLKIYNRMNDTRFKLIILALYIIPSFLFPLILSHLISLKWAPAVGIGLFMELFYFAKKVNSMKLNRI